MWNNRRTRIYIGLLIFLIICAVALIIQNRAQDVYKNVAISHNVHNTGKKESKDDSLENWAGRWMPSRPGEYTPPPKISHKKDKGAKSLQQDKDDDESLRNWNGRWMPSRPGEYTPPPKIFHKKIEDDNDSLENWKGRWIPSRPGEYTPPPKIYHRKNTTQQVFLSNKHARYINLGRYYLCDDGVNNLEVDWDHSSASYTCFGKKIVPDSSTVPKHYCDTIPINYKAEHRCMSQVIEYAEDIPTFGTSRPVWPAYGEYKYLPAQRWLHSLENGAIVLLYHPCANTLEVKHLKRLLKRCLSRRIISPNNFLDEQRPLALLSWGCKLSMSFVDESLVKKFINEHAVNDPSAHFEDGNYVDQLVERSKIVSGNDVANLCSETDKTHV